MRWNYRIDYRKGGKGDWESGRVRLMRSTPRAVHEENPSGNARGKHGIEIRVGRDSFVCPISPRETFEQAAQVTTRLYDEFQREKVEQRKIHFHRYQVPDYRTSAAPIATIPSQLPPFRSAALRIVATAIGAAEVIENVVEVDVAVPAPITLSIDDVAIDRAAVLVLEVARDGRLIPVGIWMEDDEGLGEVVPVVEDLVDEEGALLISAVGAS